MKALQRSAFLIYVLNLNKLHLSAYLCTPSGIPLVQFVYSVLFFFSLGINVSCETILYFYTKPWVAYILFGTSNTYFLKKVTKPQGAVKAPNKKRVPNTRQSREVGERKGYETSNKLPF